MNLKEEKIIELYTETELPKKGWIQGCMNCYIKTSKNEEYKKINDEKYIIIFNIYLCKDCMKADILNNEKFKKYIDKKIKKTLTSC